MAKLVDHPQYGWLQKVASVDGTLEIDAGASLPDVWSAVCQIKGIDQEELGRLIAEHFGTELLSSLKVEPRTIQLIPESLAREHCMIGVKEDGHRLVLAMADPTDTSALQQASFSSGRTIDMRLAAPPLILEAIDAGYGEAGELANVKQMSLESLDQFAVRGRITTSRLQHDTPATEKLFLLILKEAVKADVSDIHIQPFVGGAAVRFRVDGVIRQLKSMPLDVLGRLVRHIKSLADLDVINNRTPQDGRLTLLIGREARDLRISILPVEQGERVVIRLLAHGVAGQAQLNFEEEQIALFRTSMRSSSGMILVTGPTGSGKTTTLYSMLNMLNHDAANLMSVEDPVEIRMRGVSQTSVNEDQGLTFPAVLRSMLRQDPDVILVGEIRDQDTAELALRASLTGHLVLSTLHTIDAVTTIPRLIDLGLSPILLADSLLSVINQRLARRLCPGCKRQVDMTHATELEALYMQLTDKAHVFHPDGCEACAHSGYQHRIPISQVWNITEDVRNLLRSGEMDHEGLAQAAHRHGLRTLGEAASIRIDEGETSVEEVARVVGASFWSALGGSENVSVLDAIGKSARVSMNEKLLIIEPDEVFGQQLAAALEQRNYVAQVVASVEEAAVWIGKGEPLDLVLLDIENEHQTPLQSFANVSSSLSLAGLSLVLLLPQGSIAVETLLQTHGAADYLIKPVNIDRVADMVETVLARRHI